jgi:hypothetical protein
MDSSLTMKQPAELQPTVVLTSGQRLQPIHFLPEIQPGNTGSLVMCLSIIAVRPDTKHHVLLRLLQLSPTLFVSG